MRLIFSTILFLLINYSSFSQNDQENISKIGVSYSVLDYTHLIKYRGQDLLNYGNNELNSIGINYLHQIKEKLILETGLEYSQHTITYLKNDQGLGQSELAQEDFRLINIPITYRVIFLRYLFFNGGIALDLDLSNKKIFDSQSGIGGLAGIGINYDFNFGVSIFVNPYIKTHALIPFSKEDNHQRLTDSGVRIGLSCNIN